MPENQHILSSNPDLSYITPNSGMLPYLPGIEVFMRRRDLSMILFASTAGAASGTDTPNDQGPFPPYYGRTSAEKTAGVDPANWNHPEGDCRRYGADILAPDNAAAFNHALLVSANGGAPAHIPPGTWNIASALRCSSSCSMHGSGQHSILAANNCDGLSIGPQSDYSGSRFFRDFQIIGANSDRHSGITANMSAASHNRATGIQFSNLTIRNFGVAIFARGVWNSSFRDCFLYNNHIGYHFHGQSVVNKIDGGFVQNDSIAGPGPSYGILVDSVDGESCQSLHLNAVCVYAYDINICLALALYTTIENCDVSVARAIGIQLITVHGGTTIRGCWIQTHGPSTTALRIADRAAPATDKIVIEACALECDVAGADSTGIYVGANQLSVVTNGNTVGTSDHAFATGIRNNGAHNHVAKFNAIFASAKAIQVDSFAKGVEMGPNTILNGAPLLFTARTAPGFSYFAAGTCILELTGLAAAVRGPVTWAATGRIVQILVPEEGMLGQSSSVKMAGSGLPGELWPHSSRSVSARVTNNGQRAHGGALVESDGSIHFSTDADGAAFADSGTKGLPPGTMIEYVL